jgi:hypothetical protein
MKKPYRYSGWFSQIEPNPEHIGNGETRMGRFLDDLSKGSDQIVIPRFAKGIVYRLRYPG